MGHISVLGGIRSTQLSLTSVNNVILKVALAVGPHGPGQVLDSLFVQSAKLCSISAAYDSLVQRRIAMIYSGSKVPGGCGALRGESERDKHWQKDHIVPCVSYVSIQVPSSSYLN